MSDGILLGHSYGTLIALHASLNASERLRGVALLAPIGLRPHRGFRRYPSAKFGATACRLPVVGPILTSLVRKSFKSAGFRKPISNDQIHRTLDAVASWRFDTYAANVAALSLPVFGAYCSDDHLIEDDIMHDLLRRCPDGPRLHFPTGGHNLQKTRAIEVGEALVAWMDSLGCTTPQNPIRVNDSEIS